MTRDSLIKYGLFLVLVVVGVGLDQWTKWYASERLAGQRGGRQHAYEHPMILAVPPERAGATVEAFLTEELAWNRPEEIDRIISGYVYDAGDLRKLGPKDQLEAGQQVRVVSRKVVVVPGYFDFEYARNPGAAFSFMADADDSVRGPFFLIVGVLAIVIILLILRGVEPGQRLMVWGLGLIAGGALGNFIDRLRFDYVIDFILWKYTDEYRWPVFNIADSLICIGVGLMIVVIIRDSIHERRALRAEVETV